MANPILPFGRFTAFAWFKLAFASLTLPFGRFTEFAESEGASALSLLLWRSP